MAHGLWPMARDGRRGARSGQSTAEYAVLLVVVVGALLAMQIFIKRAVAGRSRESADSIGDQYDPKDTHSDFKIQINTSITTTSDLVTNVPVNATTNADVMVTTFTIKWDNSSKVGDELVGPLGTNLWQ